MNTKAISIPHHTRRSIQMLMAMMMGLALVMASAVRSEALGVPESFADLAEQVSPAVVNITTTTLIAGGTDVHPMVPEGSPFEDFFRDFLDREDRGTPEQRRNQALGSGFVISEDGFIVTNLHVIEGADEILIEFFNGGGELPAEVVGSDPNTDIAVLKVEPNEPLTFVTFGDSDVMRVGDWVMAVGNPLGQGFSVSAGIISARNRELSGTYDDYIQTDAAINRGNSGGPLFNMNAEVVGVNTAILSPNGGSIGIGFAMSSAVVQRVVDQLKEFGETRRGWLGVRIQDVTEDVAEAMQLENTTGALITDVPEGPAMEAGVEAGDLILSFDGVEVADSRDLVRVVGNAPVGKAVRLVVLRDGQTLTLKVTLGRREDAVAASSVVEPPEEQPSAKTVLGMELSEITETQREEFSLDAEANGLVVVALDETSEAYTKGMRIGDVITEAGQRVVSTIDDFEGRIAEARDAGRKSVLLLVRRGGDPRFVALTIN